MTATAPPLDEKTVRDALLRALRQVGLKPQDSWVTVRVAHAPPPRDRVYTVVIAYQPARVALSGVLRPTNRTEKYGVGVWVLDEPQARGLCEGT
jgi:hypothetical protein